MSGNCATGIAEIAIRPASVITIEMTKASRGRSMKIASAGGRPAATGTLRWPTLNA